MERQLRRKLHEMGYNGYYEYFLYEHIRPEHRRRGSHSGASNPDRAAIEPAVQVIVILACLVMCFAVGVVILLPLQWLFR